MRLEFRGTAGTDGLGVGAVLRVDHAMAAGREAVPVGEAFAVVGRDLSALAERLRAGGHPEAADISEASTLIAADPELRALVDQGIAAGQVPAAAIDNAIEAYAQTLADLGDSVLAQRATDVRAVGRRLVAALYGEPVSAGRGPVVLIGAEVAADDLLRHGEQVVAVAACTGGRAAHVAIVAKGLGVATVFGLPAQVLDLPDGTAAIVDGTVGTVIAEPTVAELATARETVAVHQEAAAMMAAQRDRPVVTTDGVAVAVHANVSSPLEAEAAVAAGATGIGLVRTEIAFLHATAWPSRTDHLAALFPVLQPLRHLPVTVRLLDFAPDKLPPMLDADPRLRGLGGGLEVLLAAPDGLTAQLRALCAMAARAVDTGGTVRILAPMVGTIEQLRQIRKLLNAAAADEGVAAPALGAMVELPAAVAVVEDLAVVADFLSVGSNDLSASMLGWPRTDERLGPLAAMQPPVLAAIARIVRAGAAAGRSVSLCGDAAAVPELLPVLLGLGPLTLSAPPPALDVLRARIRSLSIADCRRAAEMALDSR